jgi:hypothetical protein
MKNLKLHFLLMLSILLSFGTTGCDSFDVREAQKPVSLTPTDLETFLNLKEHLIQDLASIRIQYASVTTPNNRTKWMSTNSYYLYQIDSIKYASVLSKLQNKYKDDLKISDSGQVIFTLKDMTEMNTDDYNQSYTHLLISSDCNCPVNTFVSNVDTVYIDSTINARWKYVSFKALSGH